MGFFDIFKAAKNRELEETCNSLREQISELQRKYYELESSIPREKKDLDAAIERTEQLKQQIAQYEFQQETLTTNLNTLKNNIEELQVKNNEEKSTLDKNIKSTQKVQQLYKQYKAALKGYEKNGELETVEVEESLLPVVEVELNCMNVRDLRNRYNQNQREIQKVFTKYQGRYTTKANIAIYKLMVIAMEAELQNVLSTLSYNKLDTAIGHIHQIIERYYQVAVEGNQSIAPTMKSFIAEIEFLFVDTVKVEYEYYLQKQRIKEEQKALREQMRQEAEERKALEAERKKIEKEESKYNNEIAQLSEKVQSTADEEQIKVLLQRIEELKAQIEDVKKKKSDIINLQNGKAGYVYVISNLGSFGEDVFKIGMTRRIDPMDRVKELGDASVPFEFDVHSFIFSNDAPTLENTLHKELNDRRVNKVNLRKEFFRASIDEIESIVLKNFPTAEFKRTMLAEQYRQSLSTSVVAKEIEIDEMLEEE